MSKNIIGDEKIYTEKQMKLYAERCMRKLLTKYPNGEDDMGEISKYDVYRIKRVLNPNKEESYRNWDNDEIINQDDE